MLVYIVVRKCGLIFGVWEDEGEANEQLMRLMEGNPENTYRVTARAVHYKGENR